ncbi:MAG: B12-binding domain-containing radical SAM protein [Proteobacteria bacterium]|nr:B12-binding domain-containing radical SAM protein [Pseudomonadota bacterium]MBU1596349.1 B12-binding domain-containing radical SAM protein [Pseudomonadota bacterium]
MRTLLINPPWIRRHGNIWLDIASVMPPLGLAWLAAQLERQGHPVTILDAHAERLDLPMIATRLRDLGHFDLVGITATTSLITNALAIARIARSEYPEARIMLGGVHPTVLPEEVLSDPNVNLVVRGEGEMTLLEIVAGADLRDIQGISFRDGSGFVHTPERPLVQDLDSLAPPAYHLLPMSRYYPAAGAYRRLPAVSMLATRGCPGRCTFCYRLFGSRIRVRSGRLLAQEAKNLQDRFGIREISFYDDTFTVFRKEVEAFLDGLEEFGVDISWSCFSRVDAVDEDLLRRMKASGCHQIMYGVESADPDILRNIGKRITTEKVEHAVRMTQKAGIDVRAAFMIGNPGETPASMEATFQFALRLNPDLVVFNVATPFPGTEMHAWADERGYLSTKDWREYDFSRPIMNLPTVTHAELSAFYKNVYRRFYLRPGYVALRASKLRSLNDLVQAWRGVRGVLHI